MINPKELRIGNYVLALGNARKVIAIDGAWITVDGGYSHVIDIVSPIPLAGELLEKAGFEKESAFDFEFWGITGFTIVKDLSSDYGFTASNSVEIKTLHQLQNLYFAITGEELEIEL